MALLADTAACKVLLSLVSAPPFDAATYMGIDDGAKPVQLSLYLDILNVLASNTDRDAFVESRGEYASTLWGSLRGKIELRAIVVNTLYTSISDQLNPLSPSVGRGPASHSQYVFIRDSADYAHAVKAPSQAMRDKIEEYGGVMGNLMRSHVSQGESAFRVDPNGDLMECLVVNSIVRGGGDVQLGPGSLVEHSDVSAPLVVGNGSFISGIRSVDFDSVPPKLLCKKFRFFRRRVIHILCATA